MKMFEDDEYLDISVPTNKIIKEEDPDMEIAKQHNINCEEEE